MKSRYKTVFNSVTKSQQATDIREYINPYELFSNKISSISKIDSSRIDFYNSRSDIQYR